MLNDTRIGSDFGQEIGVGIGTLAKGLCVLSLAVVSLLAVPAHAQNSLAPGCGPQDEQFSVKTDKNYHPEATVDEGKAAVYLIQDDREFEAVPKPVVRMGIDGKWVGATHGSSYLFAVVDPGEHHLCAIWQGAPLAPVSNKRGALHFTAAAGQAYFFRVRDRVHRDTAIQPMEFEPLDSDEGKMLITQFSFSVSQRKK
jgi:hypothetical protein